MTSPQLVTTSSATDLAAAIRDGRLTASEVVEAHIVCPVFPCTAPHRRWPWGFARGGMPVGVQLVGAPDAEDTLLAAGLAVQRALMPRWAGPRL